MNTTIRLRNPSVSASVVTLEPWGGQYDLAPGDEVDLVVEALGETGLEIEVSTEGITVIATAVGMDLTIRRGSRQVVAR